MQEEKNYNRFEEGNGAFWRHAVEPFFDRNDVLHQWKITCQHRNDHRNSRVVSPVKFILGQSEDTNSVLRLTFQKFFQIGKW